MNAIRPAPLDPIHIVGVVEAYRRNWPHLGLPMFRAEDVLPLLNGDDRDIDAAVALLEAERVHYAPGDEQ